MSLQFLQDFVPPLTPSVQGQVVVHPSLDPTPSATLTGSGSGWNTNDSVLNLRPQDEQSLARWYQLTFSCASGFTLVGLQVFKDDPRSAIFFPVPENEVEVTVNLLSHVGPNDSAFQYTLVVGFLDDNTSVTHWTSDPTISFEPQM